MFKAILRRFDMLASKLDRIEKKLDCVLLMEEETMATVNDVVDAVAAEGTVVDSAIVLLNALSAQLAAAGTDATALAQLQADISNKTQALAAAVAANTPAASPAPTPDPAPAPADTPPTDPAPAGDGAAPAA